MAEAVRIRVETSFADIPAQDWGRLAGASRDDTGTPYNPFVSHAFLSSLEESGCAIAETGWLGQHLLLEDEGGNLLGALWVLEQGLLELVNLPLLTGKALSGLADTGEILQRAAEGHTDSQTGRSEQRDDRSGVDTHDLNDQENQHDVGDGLDQVAQVDLQRTIHLALFESRRKLFYEAADKPTPRHVYRRHWCEGFTPPGVRGR